MSAPHPSVASNGSAGPNSPADVRTVGNFVIATRGPVLVVTPAGSVESLRWEAIEEAAAEVLEPLGRRDVPRVVFDLSKLDFFGTVFLAVLVRCHKLVKSRGGSMTLCGVSRVARETLAVTQLDTIWSIHDTRDDALAALDA